MKFALSAILATSLSTTASAKYYHGNGFTQSTTRTEVITNFNAAVEVPESLDFGNYNGRNYLSGMRNQRKWESAEEDSV